MSAPALHIEDLSLALGRFALSGLDLALDPGEILVVLGPNGAGKSVTLETIAGFHRPDRGRIRLHGRDVTALAPERRRVGLLFQNFGLFPHLSAIENVAIGLTARRGGGARRGADPADLLAHFGVAHLAAQDIQSLSPGEKQRIALARAMASAPDLYLFDEPFSALDARTRETLRDELGRFLREERAAAIFVTHDEDDAAALADRLAVMKDGVLLQSGPAAAVRSAPVSRFVAEFLGIENLLAGRVAGRAGDALRVMIGGAAVTARAAAAPGGAVTVAIRAGDVAVWPEGWGGMPGGPLPPANRLPGRIVSVAPAGPVARLVLDVGCPLAAHVLARDLASFGFAPGAAVVAAIPAEAVHLIPAS